MNQQNYNQNYVKTEEIKILLMAVMGVSMAGCLTELSEYSHTQTSAYRVK